MIVFHSEATPSVMIFFPPSDVNLLEKLDLSFPVSSPGIELEKKSSLGTGDQPDGRHAQGT